MADRTSSVGWGLFSSDPLLDGRRLATTMDRETIFAILAEARSDGRLSEEEWEERGTRTGEVIRLSDIPPLVDDIINDAEELNPATMTPGEIQAAVDRLQAITSPSTPAHIRHAALRHFKRKKRNTFVKTTAVFGISMLIMCLMFILYGSADDVSGTVGTIIIFTILYGFVRLGQFIYYLARRPAIIEKEEKRLATNAQQALTGRHGPQT